MANFIVGKTFCFKVGPESPNAEQEVKPFGPPHEDLGKAKAWARRNVAAVAGESIGFATITKVGQAIPRLIDFDFGEDDEAKPEAAPAAPTEPAPAQGA